MFIKYFVIFISIYYVHSGDECSLGNLYKDFETQLILREHLSNLFEDKYIRVIRAAGEEAPYLTSPAKHFKKDIRKFFIEFGENLNNCHELETILEKLNYLEIDEFRHYKEDFVLRREFIRD
jgi:hypothetical protein